VLWGCVRPLWVLYFYINKYPKGHLHLHMIWKKKQLWYRRNGGGKAFINSLIGVQSGIKYDHFCPYATHFIYITAKSVQGPNIFLTMKCVICQGKQTWDRIPTPNPSVSILFPRGKVRTFSIVNQQLSPIRRMTLYSERCPCRKALVV